VSAPITELAYRDDDGRRFPVHLWRFPGPAMCLASGPLGGGLGLRTWVINATVDAAYARTDPDIHLLHIAHDLNLAAPGVGMLTAVDVRETVTAEECGVHVVATVGLGHPTWAAAPDGDMRGRLPGTINISAWLPVPLSPAALVNSVSTVTEAKVQALWAYGTEATGTATDALCVACVGDGRPEPYGGPRSTWGARLARAVHAAVGEGTAAWLGREGGTDRPSPPPRSPPPRSSARGSRPVAPESDSLGTTPGSP
jgi:adenosylcobinamide hydrolase